MSSKRLQLVRSIVAMQRLSKQIAQSGKSIGFVPTMGALHAGHAALFNRASRASEVVIASIFVNPTQFAPTEDLSRYPRQLKADLVLAGEAGVDFLFAPVAEELYPRDFQTWVNVDQLTKVLEGEKRPTHFRGVTTVVAKLFNIVRPDVAIFGMKDFQQAVVLRQMTTDLGYPIRYIIAPTVRERDGLALSSRNRYLRSEERKQAVALWQSLKLGRSLVQRGEKRCSVIERSMQRHIKSVAPLGRLDYLSFNRFSDLQPLSRIEKGTVCSGALYFGTTRLIDNLKLF